MAWPEENLLFIDLTYMRSISLTVTVFCVALLWRPNRVYQPFDVRARIHLCVFVCIGVYYAWDYDKEYCSEFKSHTQTEPRNDFPTNQPNLHLLAETYFVCLSVYGHISPTMSEQPVKCRACTCIGIGFYMHLTSHVEADCLRLNQFFSGLWLTSQI